MIEDCGLRIEDCEFDGAPFRLCVAIRRPQIRKSAILNPQSAVFLPRHARSSAFHNSFHFGQGGH
jgi:hypothetical protein